MGAVWMTVSTVLSIITRSTVQVSLADLCGLGIFVPSAAVILSSALVFVGRGLISRVGRMMLHVADGFCQ